MKDAVISLCGMLALISGVGAAQAQQEDDSVCPAADGVRALYGDLIADEEITFLEFNACNVLEALLSGEIGLDGQPTDGVAVPAETRALDEDYANPVLNEPVANDVEAPSMPVEGVVGPCEGDSNTLPFWPGGGVVPVQPDAVSPDIVEAQKEYLAMGCAAEPGLKQCATSHYQRFLDADEAAGGPGAGLEVK